MASYKIALVQVKIRNIGDFNIETLPRADTFRVAEPAPWSRFRLFVHAIGTQKEEVDADCLAFEDDEEMLYPGAEVQYFVARNACAWEVDFGVAVYGEDLFSLSFCT